MKITYQTKAVDHPSVQALSPRERDVLLAIACGDKPGLIADRYDLSVRTVSTYRERLLEKLGLKSSQECTAYCMLHGLIDVTIETKAEEKQAA